MSITVLADSLLSYAVEPNPDPLTVSTAKDPVIGRLDITVGSADSSPVYCKKITVRIPIGPGASALTENRAQLTSATVNSADRWVAREGFADDTWQVFEFVPERPVQVTGRAVTLAISQIEVNQAVGEADIKIIEETSPTNGSFTPLATDAPVMKFPAEFLFRNFHPTKILVANGEKASLKWDGSADAKYTMFWGRNTRDVSDVREWTTPEPLTAPTGFMLQATVTDGGQTLTHALTTVVMVEGPDLEVRNLVVTGDLKAESGTVRIKDLRGPSGVPLKIDSHTEFLKGNNVTVTNQLTVGGTLNAKGNLNAVADDQMVRIRDLRGPYNVPLK
ncbi:hypothetical protein, partial [Streptomyces monomycini]|uniref:hypothetical protein n=1 Tax=Streptomyces monomycini TaxID=371720 RepID=UPI0004AA4159